MLMRLWGEKVGPCMQVLHFSFALGTVIAPLISKPFISEEKASADGANSTFQDTNFTCLDLHLHDSWNGTQDFGSGGLPNAFIYNSTDLTSKISSSFTVFQRTPSTTLSVSWVDISQLSPVLWVSLSSATIRSSSSELLENFRRLSWPWLDETWIWCRSGKLTGRRELLL